MHHHQNHYPTAGDRKQTDGPKVHKVWFITGASSGMGLSLVKQLLVRGDRVAATSRYPQRLIDQIQLSIPTALIRNFLALDLDLTDEFAVERSIAIAYKTFGRLDVIVNNAGYAPDGRTDNLLPSSGEVFLVGTT